MCVVYWIFSDVQLISKHETFNGWIKCISYPRIDITDKNQTIKRSVRIKNGFGNINIASEIQINGRVILIK